MAKRSRPGGGNVDNSGDISGDGNVVGIDNVVTTYKAVGTNPFAQVHEAIERRPDDPKVEKEELKDTVVRIEKEAAKDTNADEGKLERWIDFVANMAPDVWDVLIATLTNPIAGLGTVARKVAEKSRRARGSASSSADQPAVTS
jgi:hypothetical protein